MQDAQDEFDKYKDLDRENSKRKAAEEKMRSAQKDYDNAVAAAEDALNNYVLTAPFDGVVTDVAVER